MPGKVNPVIPEAVMMVAAQVVGNDATIAWAGMPGNFDLNVMMPVIAYNLLQSIELLASSSALLAEKCVEGIEANRERCEELVERSLAMVTSLVPRIGYDAAAEIAKESMRTGRTVREICRDRQVLPEAELERGARSVEPDRGRHPRRRRGRGLVGAPLVGALPEGGHKGRPYESGRVSPLRPSISRIWPLRSTAAASRKSSPP